MDINGGFFPNPNGSPIWPAVTFTGPLVAGNVQSSDGSGKLAGLGEQSGSANLGYCDMVQTAAGITVATAGTVPLGIVIPAQSQILSIRMMVTTAEAAATLSVGTTAGGTGALATGASLATIGQVQILPTTPAEIALWDNTGNTDIRLTVTPSVAGAGVSTITVTYVQGINNVS